MQAVKAGQGKYEVTLTVIETSGCGLAVAVFGGEKPHVGGTAVAVPRQKTQGEGLTCDLSQICLPGHKDVYAAAEVAKLMAKRTGEPVSVSAGMHVDGANSDEIALLMSNAIEAAEMWLCEYSA